MRHNFSCRHNMPELPDLEVFSRNLKKKLAGKKLIKINALDGFKPGVTKKELQKALQGSKVVNVYREGKELRFAFQNKNVLGIHLMLRGKLQWITEKPVKHAL